MTHPFINLIKFFNDTWNMLVDVDIQDDGDARLGRLFNTLMVISTGIVLLLTIVFLLMIPLGLAESSIAYVAASFPFVVIPLSIYCIIQTKNGRIRSSVTLYVLFHMVAISLAVLLFDGILSPGWILYIWTITIAGILLTPIYALWMTGGVVVYFFSLFFLTRFGFYQPPLTFGIGREYVETACLLIMLVSTVGLLTFLNMKNLRDTLSELHKEIAERRQTEIALHLSEEKFRTLADFTYDWEAWLAPDGTYRYISPSCERITGHTAAEFMVNPKLLVNITHPDDQSKVIEHYHAGTHEAQKEDLGIDFRIITTKDEFRWISHSCTAVYGEGGQWLGRRISNRDITERKQAEAELKESEEKFRSLSEESPNMIFINKAGRVVYVNKKCEEILGYTRDEFLDPRFNFLDLIAPEHVEMIKENFANRYKGKAKDAYEYSLVTKDKRIIETSISSKIITYEGGSAILGIVTDITEHKQAEEHIAALASRYQTLLQTASDGIHILDTQGNILEANEAFCNMLGYTREELLKLNVADWDMQWPKEKLLEDLQEFIIHPTVFETKHRRKDGTIIDVEINNVSVTLEGRNYLYAASRDITERKRTEEDIKLKNEQLIKLNSEKDKFFSIIAHDLRSPFHGFLALTEIMIEDTGSFSQTELSTLLKKMNSSANNLYKLLSNLLDWAQMQKGTVSFDPREIVLSAAISQNIDLMIKRGDQKGIDVSLGVPKDQIVYADESMLNSVLRNLLSNAIKFSLKGGEVIINAKETENEMIEISITDNGTGMADSLSKKLFRMGEKVGRRGTEGEESTGLGLLLCKEFVEKHGGKIWAESEEGKGSTFYFTLPESNRENI